MRFILLLAIIYPAGNVLQAQDPCAYYKWSMSTYHSDVLVDSVMVEEASCAGMYYEKVDNVYALLVDSTHQLAVFNESKLITYIPVISSSRQKAQRVKLKRKLLPTDSTYNHWIATQKEEDWKLVSDTSINGIRKVHYSANVGSQHVLIESDAATGVVLLYVEQFPEKVQGALRMVKTVRKLEHFSDQLVTDFIRSKRDEYINVQTGELTERYQDQEYSLFNY